jgi:hypothetical protein
VWEVLKNKVFNVRSGLLQSPDTGGKLIGKRVVYAVTEKVRRQV